jgi:hypothetical protein
LLAAAGWESPFSAHPYKWTNPAACNAYPNESKATVKDVKVSFRLMKKPFNNMENTIFFYL